MKDLWTIASYPTAAVSGYFIAFFTEDAAASILGLEQWMNTVIVLAISGLVIGFLVDEVIPTYIHDVRGSQSGSAGGGGDFGGGGDLDGGDFDFE